MKIIYIVIAVSALVLAGVFVTNTADTPEVQGSDPVVTTETTAQVEESEMVIVPVGSYKEEPTIVTPAQTPDSDIELSDGALLNYTTPSDLENLEGINILFFKASWCITCTELYNALVTEKNDIPNGITIWIVDYDNNKDMRIKYGVTTQHTLVQVDTDLNKINLWRGGYSLADVLGNVK